MKKCIKSIFIMLSIIIAIAVVFSGCGLSFKKPSPNEGISQDNKSKDIIPEGGSEEGRTGEGGQAGQGLQEGMDYITIDKPMQDFELTDLKGKKVKLSDYKGKTIFLNFWATWCPPCRGEMPHMEEVYKRYKKKDVAILAVSSTTIELKGGKDDKKSGQNVKSFINKNGYTFPVLLDKDDSVASKYDSIYPMTGIPTTFIIDKSGTIRYVRPGAFLGKEQMIKFINLTGK